MIVIRSAEEMAHALNSPLDPELKRLLRGHWERLSEYTGYELAELAEFVIAQQGNTLTDIEAALSMPLIECEDEQPIFQLVPEFVEQHSTTLELTFVYSDDGFGLVLLVELGPLTDPILLAACQYQRQQAAD